MLDLVRGGEKGREWSSSAVSARLLLAASTLLLPRCCRWRRRRRRSPPRASPCASRSRTSAASPPRTFPRCAAAAAAAAAAGLSARWHARWSASASPGHRNVVAHVVDGLQAAPRDGAPALRRPGAGGVVGALVCVCVCGGDSACPSVALLPSSAPSFSAPGSTQLLAEGSHAVPVLDAAGTIVRMVTQADIIRYLGAHLDELGSLGSLTVRRGREREGSLTVRRGREREGSLTVRAGNGRGASRCGGAGSTAAPLRLSRTLSAPPL